MDIDFTEKLIQEVRNRPIIYSASHPDHKNNTKKLQAWREIQRILDEEVPVLKAKWKNLKDTYKKYKHSKRSTSTLLVRRLQNWTWADHMTFTDPPVSLNETESSVTSVAPPSEDPLHTFSTDNVMKFEEETSQNSEASNLDPTDRIIQYLQNRDRTRTVDNDERVDVKCDGTDLLFLGYADAFKKLSKGKQVSVKFKIAETLMEAEMEDLDTPGSRHVAFDINAASLGNYVAPPTPNDYSMTGTKDNSIINAVSTDNNFSSCPGPSRQHLATQPYQSQNSDQNSNPQPSRINISPKQAQTQRRRIWRRVKPIPQSSKTLIETLNQRTQLDRARNAIMQQLVEEIRDLKETLKTRPPLTCSTK